MSLGLVLILQDCWEVITYSEGNASSTVTSIWPALYGDTVHLVSTLQFSDELIGVTLFDYILHYLHPHTLTSFILLVSFIIVATI